MKASSKILVGGISGVLLVPSLTYAAWWNPFTWKPATWFSEDSSREKPPLNQAMSTVNSVTGTSSRDTATKTFYTQSGVNVRSCPAITCKVIGVFGVNSSFTWERPMTIDELPQWVEATMDQGDYDRGVNPQYKVGYISKINLGRNQVVVQDNKSVPTAAGTLSTTDSKASGQQNLADRASPLPVPNLTPADSILCNGTYWTQCPTGQDFVCPASGNAYCRLPQQQTNLLQQNPVVQETTSRAKKLEEIDRQVSNVKLQYQRDLQNLQNTLTPLQRQAWDTYNSDKQASDDYVAKNLSGDIVFQTGQAAAQHQKHVAHAQFLADKLQSDVWMIQMANQEKDAMIQALTNEANQKLLLLQRQREQIK